MNRPYTWGFKPYKEYGKFRGILNQVNEAAINHKSIEIVYFTMSRKEESRRRVDPYRIWFFNGTFYVIGFCHKRREVRIFALDRIKMLHLTKEDFEIQEDFSLKKFIASSFGVYQGEPVYIKVWFHPDVAGYIKEKVWHGSQQIHVHDDGSIIFEAEVAGTDEIRFWIMTWGSKAEVIEPEALREEIRAEAEKMAKRYERPVVAEKTLSYTPAKGPSLAAPLIGRPGFAPMRLEETETVIHMSFQSRIMLSGVGPEELFFEN